MSINGNNLTRETDIIACSLLRLPEVLKIIPVSKSTWWRGIKEGRFPKPAKITDYITAWKLEDIIDLTKRFQIN